MALYIAFTFPISFASHPYFLINVSYSYFYTFLLIRFCFAALGRKEFMCDVVVPCWHWYSSACPSGCHFIRYPASHCFLNKSKWNFSHVTVVHVTVEIAKFLQVSLQMFSKDARQIYGTWSLGLKFNQSSLLSCSNCRKVFQSQILKLHWNTMNNTCDTRT